MLAKKKPILDRCDEISYNDIGHIILGSRFSTQRLLEQGGVSVTVARAARKVFRDDFAISYKFHLGILKRSGHKRGETAPAAQSAPKS